MVLRVQTLGESLCCYAKTGVHGVPLEITNGIVRPWNEQIPGRLAQLVLTCTAL